MATLQILQALILLLPWIFFYFKIGWDSFGRLGVDSTKPFMEEALFYYSPPLLLNITLWLWGINLWLFGRYKISYSRVFGLENHLGHQEIWTCATWISFILVTSMIGHLWLYSYGVVPMSLAPSHPVLLYVVGVVILLFPFDYFYMPSRLFLLKALYRIVVPWQVISFPDIFLADIFTSMMMVFSNLERSVCRMVYWVVATTDRDFLCESTYAILLVSLLPFIMRIIQCLRLYNNSRQQRDLFNALKYATAGPMIICSILKFHEYPDDWISLGGFHWLLWLLSCAMYSLYSFCWDFMCTWDLSPFKPNNFADILQGKTWVYVWVMGSNFLIRFSWIYKLLPHLQDSQLMVVVVASLEIFRRFQWAYFFIENEWKKVISRPSEQEPLLTPSDGSEHE